MNKLLLAALLASLPGAASANWVIGVDYARALFDDSDLELDAPIVDAGYQFEVGEGLALIPSFHLGTGVGDDSPGQAKVSIKSLYGVEVRGQFTDRRAGYLFVAPRYTCFDVESELSGIKQSEDEWEFGVAVGWGYHFTQLFDAEIGYTSYQDLDQWSLGLRFNF